MIETKKESYITSRHFNERYLCSTSLSGYVKVQIIEQVYSKEQSKIEEVLSIEKDVKVNYSHLLIG